MGEGTAEDDDEEEEDEELVEVPCADSSAFS